MSAQSAFDRHFPGRLESRSGAMVAPTHAVGVGASLTKHSPRYWTRQANSVLIISGVSALIKPMPTRSAERPNSVLPSPFSASLALTRRPHADPNRTPADGRASEPDRAALPGRLSCISRERNTARSADSSRHRRTRSACIVAHGLQTNRADWRRSGPGRRTGRGGPWIWSTRFSPRFFGRCSFNRV